MWRPSVGSSEVGTSCFLNCLAKEKKRTMKVKVKGGCGRQAKKTGKPSEKGE